MNTTASEKRSGGSVRLLFLLLYFVFYMNDAAMGYFSLYLKGIGFNTLHMGALTASAALFAMLFAPSLGALADRSASKNRVMVITLAITAGIAPLLAISPRFLWLLPVFAVFTLFRNIQRPLCDSMALDYASESGTGYGPIRTMGCIGYSLMGVIAGRVADSRVESIFWLYSSAAVLTLLAVAFLPRYKGGGVGKRAVSVRTLLSYRPLVILTLVAMAFTTTKSFFANYFSVFFVESAGGTPGLSGWIISITALLEIPFTFFLDRIIRRLGIRRIIVLSGVVEGLRWLSVFLLPSAWMHVAVQILLGSINMIFPLTAVIYVNQTVSGEQKVTGLTTYATVTSVSSIVLGNLLGGAVASALGIRAGFLGAAVLNLEAVAAFLPASRGSFTEGAASPVEYPLGKR
jgi:PPP family 3-phenylpropionic acid transporter